MVYTHAQAASQTALQPQLPLEETANITVNYSFWHMGNNSLKWYSFELTNQQLSSKLQDKQGTIS
ncbi:hypothetical protein L218DRAFT_961312 [Marasmius fiardii PR-910]|nr:hypothetical protein L218DRAFT_961312 [Marasmius fiardii PR-910]